jgi:Dyp-type peroxidase family
MKPEESSRHLQGITDLTLLAPIRPGLIDGLDARTYKTRLKLLLRTLHSLRASSREFAFIRPFSDGAERIRTIHSLRLAIIEPEPDAPPVPPAKDRLLLAVTFDRPWEPYIRIIWRDVGTLLDVIFCNCEGYVSAWNHGFAEYAQWVRRAQIDAQYFFNAAPLTVDDLQYLSRIERLHRAVPGSAAADRTAAELVIEDPADAALRTARENVRPDPGEPPGETEKTGLAALAALYRLTDLYPADREDGGYLLRAAHEILRELRILDTRRLFPPTSDERRRFGAQLAWFEQAPRPARPAPRERLSFDRAHVQGGILSAYDGITHGCLVLMRITEQSAARAFLSRLTVTAEGAKPADGIFVNVALTWQGLRGLGVPQQALDQFPKEFREGMEARAGLLGDVRCNHPRRWALPERNWPDRAAAGAVAERVQLSEVDIVVQLRTAAPVNPGDEEISANPAHPLYERVKALAAEPGVRVLSVQAMLRHRAPQAGGGPGPAVDHFGFVDGISQPVVAEPASAATSGERLFWHRKVRRNRDRVARGEILCGYVNDAGDEPTPSAAAEYLDNGTFLVVRKLRQDVAALHEALDRALAASGGGLSRAELMAKMMGRTLDGVPLAEPNAPDLNDFDYAGDADGGRCPFQAHIRRANPRAGSPHASPRLMRRGMSYGPRFEERPDAERGLVFMAYNASIAEQFEVIQRWIAGGNSTGVASAQADPLLGVPHRGDPMTFRFRRGDQIVRIALSPEGRDDRPFVRLEWGCYLFVPSLPALRKIAQEPPAAAAPTDAGERILERLLALERGGAPEAEVVAAWKAVLEDFEAKLDGESAAVWAAIRRRPGGVLRTAYGVMVASKALVAEVFANSGARYTVSGYQERMRDSIGEIYLGLDEGPEYRAQSEATNAAILAIGEREAFDAASRETRRVLRALLDRDGEATFDTRELSDGVLAELSRHWFDVPEGSSIEYGGWSWEPVSGRKPRCPGDFTAPSRYLFSPHPGPAASQYGRAHGAAASAGAASFVARMRGQESALQGVLSKAMFAVIAEDGRLARTLAGVMMGFLPTVDGNLRSVLYEWMQAGTLWRLQDALVADPDPDRHAAANRALRAPLMRAMQGRPVPDAVWRTAAADHDLGGIHVRKGERIIIGIGSATQEDLEAGKLDVIPVFGGRRIAGQGDSPTHACPAYAMSMGILLGILGALLEAGTLRPTPSPTGLNLKAR